VVELAAPGHVDAVRHFVVEPMTAAQRRTVAAAGRRIEAVLDGTPAPVDGRADAAG
jgi:ribosomal protein S11